MNGTWVTRWVLLIVLALLLGSVATKGQAAEPVQQSAAACSGMTRYRNEVLAAGRDWVKGMRADGLLGVSTQSFDQRQWHSYGTRAQDLATQLTSIEPPVFAASWHEAQTELARLRQNFAVWAMAVGFEETAELYAMRVTALKTAVADGRDQATATCGRFTRLVDDWNRLGGAASG